MKGINLAVALSIILFILVALFLFSLVEEEVSKANYMAFITVTLAVVLIGLNTLLFIFRRIKIR
ncbi:MAG: hypothetical protein DSO07_02270 [Thermoproteota archaeon]|jgi:uncharacterized phage infection (PIP) family protein YhgE|uniref:Uncharacterized protein n=1 Tax=Candidatus Methanodesulfokora washburnensis TaxID=2478471 RepID=A0A429GGL6_9CREN|nr:hypothetical protein [Candidatus Methanodesulfokores washburnensis]RSN72907.1 hypothetical protein D6D85_11980 [Candidatus Methanodesulfokores washburnensis]TDA41873.1 MAG: hypothetical protein DSO07_02270 [Candidatus Korarchaeota archaeon]